MSFRETERTAAPTFVVGNALFVLLAVVIAAWAAWPIYATGSFVLLVAVALVLGIAIAALGYRRRWGWLTVAAASLVTYLLVGVPLAVPGALAGAPEVLQGWLSLVAGTVFGWKQLATITTIPVGSYQALLVPALVVFLFGTVMAASIAWRARRLSFLAVPVVIAMQGFGLVFGSAVASESTRVLFVPVTAPRELVIGAADFLLCLGFLLWRVQYARRVAVRFSQALAGIAPGGRGIAGVVRRFALAAVVLVVAVAVSAAISPALGAVGERAVLRSSIDPDTTIQRADSPLSDYRQYFTPARYDQDLFTVDSAAPSGERLRLAVMSHYDGRAFTVVDARAGGSAESAFVRVPYRLDPGVDGTTATATVTVDSYTGVWLPTLDHLEQLTFTGANARARTDGFFYNAATASAVELGGLKKGDAFRVSAVSPSSSPELASITKPSSGATTVDASDIPPNLITWVALQKTSPDAAGLADLVERLRSRGFLSHSLEAPTATDPATNWMTDASIPAFQPSYAGHSFDRINALFGQLVDKQSGQPENASAADLVAAVGDDEQFAVATALLAQYEGFPARVVLGFVLGDGAIDTDDVSTCAATCKGKNLSAWVEVQDAKGAWVTVDTTPQHDSAIDDVTSELRDPHKPTTVLPDAATEQQPPAADPSGGDSTPRSTPDEGTDLGWLVTVLKIGGLSLLGIVVVFAPFGGILFAKGRRRRDRRRAAVAEERIVGGWDEYVDTALDHGLAAPGTETRTQVAEAYRTPNGVTLALLADRAVFGPFDPADAEVERFWQLLETERLAFDRGLGRWRRLRAALSLRSFTRYLRPRPAASRAPTAKG